MWASLNQIIINFTNYSSKRLQYADCIMVFACKYMACLVVEINLFCFQGMKDEREAYKRCLAKFKKCTKKSKNIVFHAPKHPGR